MPEYKKFIACVTSEMFLKLQIWKARFRQRSPGVSRAATWVCLFVPSAFHAFLEAVLHERFWSVISTKDSSDLHDLHFVVNQETTSPIQHAACLLRMWTALRIKIFHCNHIDEKIPRVSRCLNAHLVCWIRELEPRSSHH